MEFRYKCVNVHSDPIKASGFLIVIHDEFPNDIECCYVNCVDEILSRKYFKIQKGLFSKIEKILEENKEEILGVRSWLYNDAKDKRNLQTFEFYMDDWNRVVNGYAVYGNPNASVGNELEEELIVLKVFHLIAKELEPYGIKLTLDSIN